MSIPLEVQEVWKHQFAKLKAESSQLLDPQRGGAAGKVSDGERANLNNPALPDGPIPDSGVPGRAPSARESIDRMRIAAVKCCCGHGQESHLGGPDLSWEALQELQAQHPAGDGGMCRMDVGGGKRCECFNFCNCRVGWNELEEERLP